MSAHLRAHAPLGAILALQAALSLSLRNTVFWDEALYLYAGRRLVGQLLGGPPVTDPYIEYFSGLPYIHPILAGLLDILGGAEAARGLSLVCMLGVTTVVYRVAATLFDAESARFAAAVYAVQGSVLFLGRLTTHDAISLGLLATATLLAVRTAGSVRVWPGLAVGVLLMLAGGTKYAGFLYAPSVLGVLGLQSAAGAGWGVARLRLRLALGAMVAILAAVVAVADRGFVAGLMYSTAARVAVIPDAPILIAARAAAWGGGVFALGLLGLLLGRRSRDPLALLLLATALLAPAYHLEKAEVVSLHKHIAYGSFFAAPLAGYGLARLLRGGQPLLVRYGAPLAVAIWLGLAVAGLRQAQSLYAEWPDSSAVVGLLRGLPTLGSARILAEESEVLEYYLQDQTSHAAWSNLDYFAYTDRAGQQLVGDDAYRAAIADRFFDLVVFRYGPSAERARAVDAGLRDGSGYELVARVPYMTTFGPGEYWVWAKRVGAAS